MISTFHLRKEKMHDHSEQKCTIKKNTKESGNLQLTAARDDAKEASRLVLAWPYKFKHQKNQLNLRRKGAFTQTHTHTLYVRSDIKERLTQLVKLNYAF